MKQIQHLLLVLNDQNTGNLNTKTEIQKLNDVSEFEIVKWKDTGSTTLKTEEKIQNEK